MRAVSMILKFAAIASGTLLLAHALYTTEVGGRIMCVVPDSAWNMLYEYLALEGAETTANAELAVWLVICFVVSAAFVLGGGTLVRRAFRRRVLMRQCKT